MTTLADGSRQQIAIIEEVTQGTTPASALQNTRVVNVSMAANPVNTSDNEIRSDRQFVSSVRTDISPEASIDFELSYDNLDLLLEGALFSDWSTAVNVSSADISAVNSDNSYNSGTVDFTAQNLSVGQWIKVAGFTDAANNGFCKVVSIASGKLVVSGLTLADEAVGDTVTMTGSRLRNGTTRKFYSVERQFGDVTEFQYILGAMVNTLELTLDSNSLVTGSLSMLGLSAGMQASTIGTGAPTAASTKQLFNTVGSVANILEGGTAIAAPVQSLNLTVDNALRPQKAIATLGNYGIGAGRVNVTGSMSVYFIDSTLYDKILADTATSLSFRLVDADGNAYIVDLPNIRYSAGDPDAGGIDSDVIQAIDFTALMDATLGFTIQICKIAA